MPLLGSWVGSVLESTALRNGNAEFSQGRNTSAETQQLFGAGERRGHLEVKGRGVTSRREALPRSQGCDGQPAVEKKNTQLSFALLEMRNVLELGSASTRLPSAGIKQNLSHPVLQRLHGVRRQQRQCADDSAPSWQQKPPRGHTAPPHHLPWTSAPVFHRWLPTCPAPCSQNWCMADVSIPMWAHPRSPQ